MPEYTYLLENRLSAAQKNAMTQVRDAARASGMTVFLAGGAVRDLTTGSSVRDLDFAVQGNVLELEAALAERGGVLWGKHEASRTLFFWFPGSVRVEVTSTRSETFPQPGKPVYSWSGIVDDLHRRDFTANAMALSLNEGSYGLLLDPLNGVADIEVRQLRLSSNYGFLDDPARLVRAVRLRHRLGWHMEERTQSRYENAKEAGHFDTISPFLRGYELEKIAAEDEALGVLKALEEEGWMAKLLPAWTSASVDIPALEDLHRNRIQLLMQGISPDLSAAHLEIMTAKMKDAERTQLKAAMVRPGLLAQWEGLDDAAKEFGRLLTSREMNAPSAAWTLFHSHAAEAILWLAHSRKGAALETKFRNFFTVWPEAAKQVPVAMMLEMRITPDLPSYAELLHELFLQQIDGKLENDEQMRAFLEPYSPPAPPPPVTLRRTRSKKSADKTKRKGAARDPDDDDDDDDRPAARDEDDEDEDDETEDSEPHADMPVELGVSKKVDFDKVDMGALLGRIDAEEPEDGDDSDDTDIAAARAPEEPEAKKIEETAPVAKAPVAKAPAVKAPEPKTPPVAKAPAAGKASPAETDREHAPVKAATQPTAGKQSDGKPAQKKSASQPALTQKTPAKPVPEAPKQSVPLKKAAPVVVAKAATVKKPAKAAQPEAKKAARPAVVKVAAKEPSAPAKTTAKKTADVVAKSGKKPVEKPRKR
jgi:tRNA nucleotidyltransferase (CCA-adding enzyme)